nr:hypothetical protein [Lysinibacillus timonensis]
MKKFIYLFASTLVLSACSQEAEPQTQGELAQSEETKGTENDGNKQQEEAIREQEAQTEPASSGPSEVFLELQSNIVERLNSLQFLRETMGVVYNDSNVEHNLILNIARSFPDEVPMLGQGDVLNGFYEWYSPDDLNQAISKYHGFTIDFEKYRNSNEEEVPMIYFDGDFVYLVSADFAGTLDYFQPTILSIEQMDDQPIYYVELQNRAFHAYEYEMQNGEPYDFSVYVDVPFTEWPEEMQQYIGTDPTIYHALFIENEAGFALAYYSMDPLLEADRVNYIDSLN